MASIRINNAVRDELLWFAKHAQESDGIFFLKSVAWDPASDMSNVTTCYTDACTKGMAYWFPEFNLGFQCHIPEDAERRHIFFFEALTVTCAILDTSHSNLCLVVYSDNHNTVDIWHSLQLVS
jgi:hypothetical protein